MARRPRQTRSRWLTLLLLGLGLFGAGVAVGRGPRLSAQREPSPPIRPDVPASPDSGEAPPRVAGGPTNPLDFNDAKRALRRLTSEELRREVYCGCRFDERLEIDFTDCEAAHPYQPVEPARERAHRVEWDHVLPASWLYHERPCAREHPRGTDARRYCREHDSWFRFAEGDMHNLVPAIGQINALRENYPYAELEGEDHIAGCDFEVHGRQVEPREAVRGDLARATLYMASTYDVPLRDELRAMLERWHREDPPSDAERRRHDRIATVQGNVNPYVTGSTLSGPREIPPSATPRE